MLTRQTEKTPTKFEKRPTEFEKRPRKFEKHPTKFEKHPTKWCCPMVENQLFPHQKQQKRVESLHRPRVRGRKLAVDSLFRGYDRVEEILDVRKLIRFWGFEFKTSRSGNSQFNLNRSLAPEQILFDCSADGLSFAFGVVGYGENERKTRCPQENERWQEVIYSISSRTITV